MSSNALTAPGPTVPRGSHGIGAGRRPKPMMALPTFGRNGMSILAFAATIALILGVVTTGYLTQRGGSPPPTGEGGSVLAPSAGATPEGTPAQVPPACTNSENLLDICGLDQTEGVGFLVFDLLPAEQLAIQQVQMQGWEVDAGNAVTFDAGDSPTNGVAMDFVVGGAYQAIFAAPVAVSRSGGVLEYPDAHTTIELARGDSVSYALGTKEQMSNPLDSIVLKIKTVVISSVTDPGEQGASGPFRFRVDGNGTLPKLLSEFNDAAILRLSYTRSALDPALLQTQGGKFSWWVLGPVASRLAGGGPGSGFVLWIGQPQG